MNREDLNKIDRFDRLWESVNGDGRSNLPNNHTAKRRETMVGQQPLTIDELNEALTFSRNVQALPNDLRLCLEVVTREALRLHEVARIAKLELSDILHTAKADEFPGVDL